MPNCPECGSDMIVKTARRGRNAGGQFYGCSQYPSCKGTRDMERSGNGNKQEVQIPIDIETPDCPKCGSKMVVKTARSGRNAGNQFFGCSTYPKCKEIVNIENINNQSGRGNQEIISHNEESNILNFTPPVFLQAREKFQNYQVRFFQTLALPSTVLEQVNFNQIDRKELLSHSQWRLDYPVLNGVAIDGKLKTVLNIALKILTRGQLTIVSPEIENKIRKQYKIKDYSDFSELNFNIYSTFSKQGINKTYSLFDSDVEANFYNSTLLSLFGDYYYKYVIPQIDFSSLNPEYTGENSDFRRADFLINTGGRSLVVELDGVEHEEHKSRDDERDELLARAGYEVLRIKNNEVDANIGTNIQKLHDLFENFEKIEKTKLTNQGKYCVSMKIAHQLQIIIIEALLTGALDFTKKITIQFDDKSVRLSKIETVLILKVIEGDINNLLDNLCRLYQVEPWKGSVISVVNLFSEKEENSILISYNDNKSYQIPTFYLQEITFNKPIAQRTRTSKLFSIEEVSQEVLEYFLNYIFRFDSFLEGQYEAIARALSGKDAIVLLPTGSGKSLAFQLATMILPGVSIVIDPIIALINDQIDNLHRIGIDRAIGITSQIKDPRTRSLLIDSFGQGEYVFCYVAPERFQTEEFRDTLRNLTVNTPVSVIVIDEAHCVSEWGHDFRTSYLNIGRVAREYCKYERRIPPLLALTGTASNAVLRDVQRELQISDFDAIITPRTFDRKELNYFVFESTSAEKYNILKGCLQRLLPEKFNMSDSSFYQSRGKNTHCGLVFCPHVGGSFGVVENAQKISGELGISAKCYGGRAPKGWGNDEWDNYKNKAAKDFKNNQFPLLIATKSFGMGIDKPNIRYTVHFGIPSSIESFYQEAGRAGRDRGRAECGILISNDNSERTDKLLDPGTTPEQIATIMDEEIDWNNADDITRAIWFHVNAFKGVRKELEDVSVILDALENLSSKDQTTLNVPRNDRQTFEKGVHRLVILGVVSDYTIDYANNEFYLKISGIDKEGIVNNYAKYVRGYNRGRVISEVAKVQAFINEDLRSFIRSTAEILISFIYETIEKGRRRALREMLTLAEDPLKAENSGKNMDTIIRERILRYLESTYSEEIELIIKGESAAGFEELKLLVNGHETKNGELIGGIRSPKDASEVRGQSARYLESTPDHPGLLFLRALSEVYCKNSDTIVIEQNIIAGVNSALNKYSIEKEELYNFLAWLIGKISEHNSEVAKYLISVIVYQLNDADFAKALIKSGYIEMPFLYTPSLFLFSKTSQEAVNIFS